MLSSVLDVARSSRSTPGAPLARRTRPLRALALATDPTPAPTRAAPPCYTHRGVGFAPAQFEISWDLCWEERQLDWWSMALIGNAFTDFEVGEGWDCLTLIKDEMSRAIATRNFFIFERICVFLLPYLWEMDTEIKANGAINPEGDCYEEWVAYFVDQSAVLSNESTGDKSRNR